MQLQFGTMSDASNVINKQFTYSRELHGTARIDLDILNPTFWVHGYKPEYNYCYIPELKRFYYVTNVIICENGVYAVNMHVDVLKSYASSLTAENVIGKSDIESHTIIPVEQGIDLASIQTYVLVAIGGGVR